MTFRFIYSWFGLYAFRCLLIAPNQSIFGASADKYFLNKPNIIYLRLIHAIETQEHTEPTRVRRYQRSHHFE
ncbi:MAG: hypothetical protein ABS873_04520 [Alkalibacterium sp.]